jgi:hypothetical protein
VRRAHKITSMIQGGQVYFDTKDPGQQRLIDELIMFPTGDHDDCADAFIGALERVQECSLEQKPHTGPMLVRAEKQGYKKPVIVRQFQGVGPNARTIR